MGDGLKTKTLGWNSKNFDTNFAYDSMMSLAKAQWGMSEKEVEDFMNRLAYQESKGDETAVQRSNKKDEDGIVIPGEFVDGPGRGLFQYEVGDEQGGHVARVRFAMTMNGQGFESHVGGIPEDFSTISAQLQKAIFLADAMKKGGNPKTMGTQDWWIAKHWVGNKKSPDFLKTKSARIDSFKADQPHYDQSYFNDEMGN